MWLGNYTILDLLGLLIQSIFVENILLSNFLGMCTYLACSSKLKVANGLGIAVVFVLTGAGILNWFVHQFITQEGALVWLSFLGIDGENIDLNFLEFIIFISVIAAFVQILEIVIEKISLSLYQSLGIYLPLITVNCAILGACLFSVNRNYPFIPHCIYIVSSGLGWWLAIALVSAIREKLQISDVIPSLKGIGIVFIVSGFMSMAFSGFSGIRLSNPIPYEVKKTVKEKPLYK